CLDRRFPSIKFVSMSDTQQFDIAIRLSQAWSISTLWDLSQRARSFAITILDSIGPDVIYASPRSEQAFQLAGEYADGLIYISHFSQQQYKRRFATHPELIEAVIHLSLDPADYAKVDCEVPQEAEWILLFGNKYDHKDIARTTSILATAFPFEWFKVVGTEW